MSRLALPALLLIAGTLPGQPKARTDADGIALPDGAVARLGSARYRFDGTPMGPLAFSPDGRRIAVGSPGGVNVLDVATGRAVHRFGLPDETYVQLVRFLADGRRLAVGSHGGNQGGQVVVYDLADGKPAATWKLPGKNQIMIADVTSDGSRVLYVDWFAKVVLWDVKAQQEIWSFPHTEPASVQPFTADGKHFAMSGYGSGQSELRDAGTGKLVGPYPKPDPRFSGRQWSITSPDGRLARPSDKGDTVVVLAAQGSNRLRVLPSDRPPGQFAFSPDGRYLVGTSTQVWDLKEKDDRGPIAKLPDAQAAAFSADGKTLALAGDGYLTFWSVGDWKPLPQAADPPSEVRRVWFAADGKSVLGYTRTGWVSWPAAGGAATRISDDSPTHPEGLADVSADGRTAADILHEPGRGADRGKSTLRVTDLSTNKDRRFPLDGQPWAPLHVSADGRHVSGYLGNVGSFVLDARTGKVLYKHPRDNDGFLLGSLAAADGNGLAFSLRGVWNKNNGGPGGGPSYSAVTVTDHSTGRKWDLEPMPWSVYTGGGRFSRDGTRLVVHGHFDDRWRTDSVSVWDVRTGRRIMNREGDTAYTSAISPAADCRSLLIGDGKGKLALVEVATGGERAVFRHHGRVMSANFSPDGLKAVSSSPDAPAYVWDLLGSPGRWDAAMAEALWADLLSSDAKVAFAAIRTLRAHPAEAIAFLKERVKLPAAPTDEAIAKLLRGLDAAAFTERERSQKELIALADLIRPKLVAARKPASEEAGRRLDQVLKSSEDLTPEKRRLIRACEVLEGIGTPEALAALRTCAAGPEGARLTTEAKESVARRAP